MWILFSVHMLFTLERKLPGSTKKMPFCVSKDGVLLSSEAVFCSGVREGGD